MIKIGDSIPDVPLYTLHESTIKKVNLKHRIEGKKVIIFAVPGAFTPTCSKIHLPSFVKQADALKAKGIEEIFCIAINDPYVLDIWGKVAHATGKITLLSDGNGEFTKAMGLELEAIPLFGLRSKRYVAVLENGIITSLQVETNPTKCTTTCAEEILKII